MRFASFPLLAALALVPALATAASAQNALRGAFDAGETEPLVLFGVQPDAESGEGSTELPEEDPQDGRVQREPKVDTTDPLDVETGSIKQTRPPEGDPYAALGIRAGTFILYPSLTVTGGYTTNASGATGGSGSGFATATPELRLQSTWAWNEATLTLRGSYEKFFDGATDDKPTASAQGTGRIDLADGWNIGLAAGYTYDQQSISDPNFPAGVDRPPGVHGITGSTSLNGGAGPARFTVETDIARTIYENGASGGMTVDQGDRNNTVYGARLRLGYQATASLEPFVQGSVARRQYDRIVDNDGLRRSSIGSAASVGVVFDRAPVLRGEIAIGYAQENFDDASLSTLAALTVDGSLVWSPTELTTVTFATKTGLNPSADPASSGSVVYDGSIELAYAWRSNFTLNWTAGIRHERFQGLGQIDKDYKLGVGATWKINRNLHLIGGYVHEWLESNAAGRSFQSDAVRLELKLQH